MELPLGHLYAVAVCADAVGTEKIEANSPPKKALTTNTTSNWCTSGGLCDRINFTNAIVSGTKGAINSMPYICHLVKNSRLLYDYSVMISRKINTVIAVVGVLMIGFFCHMGQAHATDPVLDTPSLSNRDVQAKWIDRATIQLTVKGAVMRFFDANLDDKGSNDHNYKVITEDSTCQQSQINFKDGGDITLDSVDSYMPGKLTFWGKIAGSVGSSSANGCVLTHPDPFTLATISNKENVNVVFKQLDASTIIRVDNSGDWKFTKSSTNPSIYLRTTQNGDACQDFVLVNGSAVALYEIKSGNDSGSSDATKVVNRYFPGCKLAHNDVFGVGMGSAIPLGSIGSGVTPGSHTSNGQTSTGGGSSSSGQPTAVSVCGVDVNGDSVIDQKDQDPNGDGTISNEEKAAFEKGCDTECKDDGYGSCIYKYVNVFINFLTAGVGVVIIIMVIIGGIQYSTSSGDPNATGAAKARIANALIALIAFILMYAVLQWLIPGGAF